MVGKFLANHPPPCLLNVDCEWPQRTHKDFAMKWVVHDKEEEGIGKSLFTHNNGQSSNTFFDQYFEPEWEVLPEIPTNV